MNKILLFLSLTFFVVNFSSFKKSKVNLNILIRKANHIYYYENKLALNGSNLKMGSSKTILYWIQFLKKENDEDNVFYILKIQEKDSLNEDSKKLIDFIKSQKQSKISKLTTAEKQLIDITEKINSN